LTEPLFLLGLLLYFGAAAGALYLCRRSPAAAVGLALWLAALLPTQSVIPKLDALANRPLSLRWPACCSPQLRPLESGQTPFWAKKGTHPSGCRRGR
jgi:hypothetical protein